MILKVLIIFDPELNLFKSYAYTFMQQSHFNNKRRFKSQVQHICS